MDPSAILTGVTVPVGFEVGGEQSAFARAVLRITRVFCYLAALFAVLRAMHVLDRSAAVVLLALDLLHLISIIAFLVWFRRAHANLVLLGLPMRHGSTAAIAMFFIPVANLLLPPIVIGEVWSGSAPTTRLRRERGLRVEVARWWSVYVIAAFLYGAGRYLSVDDELRGVSSALLVAGCLTGSVAAHRTLTLIEQIDRRETLLLSQPLELDEIQAPKRSWRDYFMPVSRALADELSEDRDPRSLR